MPVAGLASPVGPLWLTEKDQRVWPMPTVPGRSAPSCVRSLSTCSRPRDFSTRSVPAPQTAMPVES